MRVGNGIVDREKCQSQYSRSDQTQGGDGGRKKSGTSCLVFIAS